MQALRKPWRARLTVVIALLCLLPVSVAALTCQLDCAFAILYDASRSPASAEGGGRVPDPVPAERPFGAGTQGQHLPGPDVSHLALCQWGATGLCAEDAEYRPPVAGRAWPSDPDPAFRSIDWPPPRHKPKSGADFSVSQGPARRRRRTGRSSMAGRAPGPVGPCDAPKEIVMAHEDHSACIDACLHCALACEHCAAACLKEPELAEMAACIRLDRDCADLCLSTAAFMARGSEFDRALCRVCAEVCQACADECARHAPEHCRQCASACRDCAQACARMAD